MEPGLGWGDMALMKTDFFCLFVCVRGVCLNAEQKVDLGDLEEGRREDIWQTGKKGTGVSLKE